MIEKPPGTTQSRIRGSTPQEYEREVASSPILSSIDHGWRDVLLNRFQVALRDIKLSSTLHRVVLHLAGPIHIERTLDGRKDRSWSESGCSSIMPAGVPVVRSFKGQADYVILYLAPEVVGEVAASVFGGDPEKVQLVDSLAVADGTVDRLVRLLLAETERRVSGTQLYADSLTRALALHLLRAYSTKAPRKAAPAMAMAGWRLRRALDFMHANLADDLTLVQLAKIAGLGPTQFTRTFRAAVGEPPYRYLVRLRVDHARQLLERTSLPITDVAFRCGFDQANHFAIMFRKVTGLTPRAYRKERST